MKTTLYLLILTLYFQYNTIHSQVGINTTTPDKSSILDIVSTDKGVLLPRLTDSQIQLISEPAKGLTVFNLDCNTIDFNRGNAQNPDWIHLYPCKDTSELDFNCGSISVNGTYISGIDLDNSNTITISVNVTKIGVNPNWNYTINTDNGYSFSGKGTFTSTGIQTITLVGSGAPILAKTDTLSFESCTATITVTGTSYIATIGDPLDGSSSSSYFPARYSSYTGGGATKYNWSTSIYQNNTINKSGYIKKIGYLCREKYSACTGNIIPDQKIYMKMAPATTTGLPYTSAPTQKELDSEWVLVYSGGIAYKRGDDNDPPLFTEITLNSPFIYDKSKDLLIHFENNSDGFIGGGSSCHGYSGEVSFRKEYMAIHNCTRYGGYNNGTANQNSSDTDDFLPITKFFIDPN